MLSQQVFFFLSFFLLLSPHHWSSEAENGGQPLLWYRSKFDSISFCFLDQDAVLVMLWMLVTVVASCLLPPPPTPRAVVVLRISTGHVWFALLSCRLCCWCEWLWHGTLQLLLAFPVPLDTFNPHALDAGLAVFYDALIRFLGLVHFSVCLSVCMSLYVSLCLCLSVSLSVCLSVSLALSLFPPPPPPCTKNSALNLIFEGFFMILLIGLFLYF